MKNLIFLFIILFSLISCTTVPAPIITNSCNPPLELMKEEEESLSKVESESLSQPEILEYWIIDDTDLIRVKKEKNALVNHVKKYCQDKN